MRVFDCFTFNDELDLLELRLMELSPVVDVFVLAEAPITFTLRDKPLHYQENQSRFAKWNDKIRHVVVEDIPREPHPAAEYFQRRALMRGLQDVEPTDLVMIGDVDEIVHRNAVMALKGVPNGFAMTLSMPLYFYSVNLLKGEGWSGTVMCPGAFVKDPEHLRQSRHFFPKITDGASHFSWLGDSAQVSSKLDAIDVTADAALYGTSDIVKPDDPKTVRERVENGFDLFGRGDILQKVPIAPGRTHPEVIHEWILLHPEYVR